MNLALWTYLLVVICGGLSAAHANPLKKSVHVIPATVSSGTSVAQFVSGSDALDGPMVAPVNASAFDWWYFDVVSEDYQNSMVIIFFTTPNTSFPFTASSTDILEVIMTAQTPDDATFYDGGAFATEAIVMTDGNGASGVWEDTGFSFVGDADLSRFEVFVDAPSIDAVGSIVFESIAPAHYPCSAIGEDVDLQLFPHLGWANAIPDAKTTVNFKLAGVDINYTGVGYHDKNWANKPFQDMVDSWYWGHGRVGPYSVVWFDALLLDGNEYTSGYVAQDGEILGINCSGVSVRPTGDNSTYPPLSSTGNPSGYAIQIDLGTIGIFEAALTPENILLDTDVYRRFTGPLVGGFQGSTTYNGTSLLEQFSLSDS
ncbi:hypothetical protein FISHEDRAFT_32652 [Fistulina hepatica ATCC 64428]|uniref:AttH domain-containing protein n=1 Tax=Fistulina hepatica ATCC 64428 TaxID=1128425 RepID=A0A0D7AQH2_9AGAR|nr:hypothetical protein FISHEDRAFT_32652 [Fistulina hepatica ATCC 64428]